MMIEPTVGRVMLYRHPEDVAQVLHAAVICFVHHGELVNLSVLNTTGHQYTAEAVTIFEGDEKDCPAGQVCWMAYQKKVAQKSTVKTLP